VNEFFREKYGEILIHKQLSLSSYELALNNLLTAIEGKMNVKEDSISKEFADNMNRTLKELEKLQVKKLNMGGSQPFDFSDSQETHQSSPIQINNLKEEETIVILNDESPKTPIDKQKVFSTPFVSMDSQKDFLQSESEKQSSSYLTAELNDDLSKKLEENDTASLSASAYSKDSQKDLPPTIIATDDSSSSTEIKKEAPKKIQKKKNKNILKVSIINDAPTPPPWIHK
jgi:hypothetical protein